MRTMRRLVIATVSIAVLMTLMAPSHSIDAIAGAAAEADLLDRLLDAPYANEMTAAPAGSRVAWVMNERGTRNIWTADASGGPASKRTDHRDDDGQELWDLQWSAD